MLNSKTIFTKDEQLRIITAIERAENKTSGEIRLHVEDRCRKKALDKAKEWFRKLKMFETRDGTGILIYLAVKDQKVAIYGGRGIHEAVGQSFWNEDVDMMINHFKDSKFAEGIISVIERIGEKLHQHFPIKDDDTNELSNDISFGSDT